MVAVGGAIDYPRYNPLLRLVLKFISKKNGGPTDTSRKHELTDWDAVERTTLELLATFESARTVASAQARSTGLESAPRLAMADASDHPPKVLVVDDNEQNRALAQASLEDEGMSVLLAKNGEVVAR